MPTPFRQLLYTPIRIEAKDRYGSTSAGTSFVFQDVASPSEHQLFLVSNKHVVAGAEEGYLYFPTEGSDGRPVKGKPFFVRNDMFWMQWHGHPDPDVDVAVMPLSWQLDMIARGGTKVFLRPIALDEVAGPSTLESLDVTAPVLFVGFPNGMFDEKHYLPIFRRGYVATAPDYDFNGEPVFLIDASVFPGSSGSPVFTVGDTSIGGTPSMKLLGVIAAVYTQPAGGEILWRASPTVQEPVPMVDQVIDLGRVFKARCIRETIASFWEAQRKRAAAAAPGDARGGADVTQPVPIGAYFSLT
ncbi:MAG TPA: serine protease [Gallionellaceae bacterium]|nr:serine protease [Gallionellaceae bacterium]